MEVVGNKSQFKQRLASCTLFPPTTCISFIILLLVVRHTFCLYTTEENAGSLQLIYIYSLYNMNSSNQHRRGMQNLTIMINTYVVFHPDHEVDLMVTLGFRCSIALPVILLSTLSLQRYRDRLKTRFKCRG